MAMNVARILAPLPRTETRLANPNKRNAMSSPRGKGRPRGPTFGFWHESPMRRYCSCWEDLPPRAGGSHAGAMREPFRGRAGRPRVRTRAIVSPARPGPRPRPRQPRHSGIPQDASRGPARASGVAPRAVSHLGSGFWHPPGFEPATTAIRTASRTSSSICNIGLVSSRTHVTRGREA